MDTQLIRRAIVTPWGEPVYVIPVKQPGRGEAISLLVGSGGGCCALAADIARFGQETTEGAGRSYAGGSTRTRITVLVPDGVATVEFVLPHPVTVRVHANVAAVQVAQACCAGPPAMIWRGAHGQVVRRVGGAAPRAGATPRPGPETVRSRAAERDPSTPNRVWVTPRVGGPHTDFRVHFQVLLNDADYSYRLSGTRCPAITSTAATAAAPTTCAGGSGAMASMRSPARPGAPGHIASARR